MDREKQFEKFLGIKTDDEEVLFGNYDKPYYAYEASEYDGLIAIFDAFPLKENDTLVDFGCGMGRVLFYCNQRFMCNVTGIEYDDELFERLLDNQAYYHVRFGGQEKKFHLHHMAAEDYIIRPEENYFYFFNPFSNEIMKKVLDRIVASVKGRPRKVTFFFYYCTYKTMELLREYPFKLEQIIKLPAYRFDAFEKAYVCSYGV